MSLSFAPLFPTPPNTSSGLTAGLPTATNLPLSSGLQQIMGTLPPVPNINGQPLDLTKVISGLQVPSPSAQPFTASNSILPFAQIGGPPLDINAAAALKQYQHKYSTLLPQLQAAGIPPMYLNALNTLDTARVQNGSAPLTNAQTMAALQTAISGQAATPAKHTPWWNFPVNAFHDLSNIVTGIPHIPAALYQDITHFGEIPGDISKALGTPGGLGAEITALSNVPGINLIPGLHTAGTLLSGHLSDIVEHPVSTALDILPVASAAGIGEKLADSALGDTASAARESFNNTRVGQIAQQLWGVQSREQAIMAQGVAHSVINSLNPSIASSDLLDTVAKDSVQWAKNWHDTITPDRSRYLTDAAENGTWAQDPTITPIEHAALSDYRDIVQRYAQYGEDHNLITQQQWLGGREVFTPAQAQTLLSGRLVVDRYSAFTPVANALRAAFAPLTSDARVQALADTPDAVRGLVDSSRAFVAGTGPGISKRALLQGLAHVYDTYGYQLPAEFRGLVNGGKYTEAYDALDRTPIMRNPAAAPPDQLTVTPWLTRANKYTDAGLSRVQQLFSRQEVNLTPARWSPVVEDAIKRSVGSALSTRGYLLTDNPNFDLYHSYLQNGLYRYMVRDGLITPNELSQWMGEARQTVLDAKAAGIDPLFMHRVGVSQMQEVDYPKPLRNLDRGIVANPTQVRARTLATAPYVHDLSVGLTHQGLEWLNNRAATSFLKEFLRTTPVGDEVVAPFARTEADLRAQYNGSGRAARILSRNPALDQSTAVLQAMQHDWVRFPVDTLPADIKQALGFQSTLDPGVPWLPRPIYDNLRMLIHPPTLPGFIEAPTAIFRNSVLGMSPRFLLNHLIGGAVLTAAQTSPLALTKYLHDAIDIVRAHESGNIAGMGDMPESFRNTFGSVRDPLIEWNYHAGGKLADMMQAAREKSPAFDAAANTSHKILSSSYNLVGFMSDAYRAVNYLYGRDAALREGLTDAQAAAAGEQLARKTILAWDNQTPMERVVLKSIFPFYGFTQQILRYAFHYPIDHPFRAATVAAISRSELQDLGSGLPQSLLSALFLGHPDAQGNVGTIQANALNPWRDVANLMTLTGLLKGTNPIISTILQQAGLDLSSGGTNLYPNIAYDPETGRLTASHPNPITNMLYNTIPQAQLLTGLIDRGSELRALVSSNPQSGINLALSQAGLPVIYKQENIPQQEYKAELARESAQSTALSGALKSGNWRSAATYPGLQGTLSQFQQLQNANLLDHWSTGEQLRQMEQLVANTIQGG